jgi:membrane protease YdiL (CAAX protease family)
MLLQVIFTQFLNLLDNETVNLQMSLTTASPVLMLFVAGILAPIVEETLFRGALFGRLHARSHSLAWVVSVVLFATLHVWQFALSDPAQWLYALTWLPMSIIFAFVYHRSGNIFTAITLHMLYNIIAVLLQILLIMT